MKGKKGLLFFICLLIVAGAAGYVTYYANSERNRGQIYNDMQSAVSHPESEQPSKPEPEVESEASASISLEPEVEPYVCPVDFDSLHKVNEDIYAWIEIPDTEVAYPVLQHDEDTYYYLNHTVEGVEGLPGSIYTDTGVAKDWSNYITVVYGHNMKNRTMFGSLKDYRDEDFLKAHPYIYVYTPEAKYTYQIFASVVYDDRLITAEYDQSSAQDRKNYLDSILNIRDMSSHILSDVPVTPDDNILTLSTCIAGAPENRYLVEAVLTDVQR